MISVTLPFRLKSPNKRMHYMAHASKAKMHRSDTCLALRVQARRLGLPATVLITRIGPRTFDKDNNVASCKNVQDGIADAFEIKDNDPRISFDYTQQKGKYGVLIQIERAEASK